MVVVRNGSKLPKEKSEKIPSKTALPKFYLFQWGQYLPGSPLISFSVNFIVSHNITFYGKPINPTHNSIQFQQISRATISLYFLTNFSTTHWRSYLRHRDGILGPKQDCICICICNCISIVDLKHYCNCI